MHLVAGLRPDPLGELEHSPRPLSRNWGEGCILLRGREGKGKRDGRGWEGRKGRGGKEGEGADPRPGLGKCKGGNPSDLVNPIFHPLGN